MTTLSEREEELLVNAAARKLISFVVSTSLMLGLAMAALSHETPRPANPGVQQTDQAGTALHEGRRLLKRGKADQALGRLQTALNLYGATNNQKGIAAAHNELGDLYLRQGQNKTALAHYQQAYEALTGAKKRCCSWYRGSYGPQRQSRRSS